MKLVDILARELKQWPECLADSLGQAADGTLHSEEEFGPILRTDNAYTICDNFVMDIVTRAQWQAAVDALKAEAAPAWVGIGLPPIGLPCEGRPKSGGDWRTMTLRYRSLDFSVFEINGEESPIWNTQYWAFRPIRTPEQIVAEEQAKAIDLAMRMINATTMVPGDQARQNIARHVVETMIKDGYRKFEIMDKDDGEGEV